MKNNQSGSSLLSVTISVGMVGILAAMASRMAGQSKQVIKTISHESQIMDLRHYLKSNFSCDVTKKKYKDSYGVSCPSTLTSVDAYRHDEDLLVLAEESDAEGTEFYKFRIKSECKGDDFHFYYSDSKVDGEHIFKHMFNGIPISCADVPNSNFQVLVNQQWKGLCCPTAGASPVLTNDSCEWVAHLDRRLEDLDTGLFLDCPELDSSGSFGPVDCTCKSGTGETYHGVIGHLWSSVNLPNGAPIFPDAGAPTCNHINSDGTMSTIYSVDGATSTPPPINKAVAWDGEDWLPNPDACHHFRILSP